MGTPEIVLGIFEFVVLLFALSLHESAHGWMASRLGDQTARMLGRITLNPLKHIDPIGTIALPLVALFTHIPLIGWAKPTPVNTRNFKNFVRDDILTTLAGPVSNIIGSVFSLIVLMVIAKTSPIGLASVRSVAMRGMSGPDPQLMALSPVAYPLTLIFYFGMLLNLFLAAFNLLPLPPLDGSRILLDGTLNSPLSDRPRIPQIHQRRKRIVPNRPIPPPATATLRNGSSEVVQFVF